MIDNEWLVPIKVCQARNVKKDVAEPDVEKCYPCQGNVWLSLQSTSTDSSISVLFSKTTLAKQKEHPVKNEREVNTYNHNDFSN